MKRVSLFIGLGAAVCCLAATSADACELPTRFRHGDRVLRSRTETDRLVRKHVQKEVTTQVNRKLGSLRKDVKTLQKTTVKKQKKGIIVTVQAALYDLFTGKTFVRAIKYVGAVIFAYFATFAAFGSAAHIAEAAAPAATCHAENFVAEKVPYGTCLHMGRDAACTRFSEFPNGVPLPVQGDDLNNPSVRNQALAWQDRVHNVDLGKVTEDVQMQANKLFLDDKWAKNNQGYWTTLHESCQASGSSDSECAAKQAETEEVMKKVAYSKAWEQAVPAVRDDIRELDMQAAAWQEKLNQELVYKNKAPAQSVNEHVKQWKHQQMERIGAETIRGQNLPKVEAQTLACDDLQQGWSEDAKKIGTWNTLEGLNKVVVQPTLKGIYEAPVAGIRAGQRLHVYGRDLMSGKKKIADAFTRPAAPVEQEQTEASSAEPQMSTDLATVQAGNVVVPAGSTAEETEQIMKLLQPPVFVTSGQKAVAELNSNNKKRLAPFKVPEGSTEEEAAAIRAKAVQRWESDRSGGLTPAEKSADAEKPGTNMVDYAKAGAREFADLFNVDGTTADECYGNFVKRATKKAAKGLAMMSQGLTDSLKETHEKLADAPNSPLYTEAQGVSTELQPRKAGGDMTM